MMMCAEFQDQRMGIDAKLQAEYDGIAWTYPNWYLGPAWSIAFELHFYAAVASILAIAPNRVFELLLAGLGMVVVDEAGDNKEDVDAACKNGEDAFGDARADHIGSRADCVSADHRQHGNAAHCLYTREDPQNASALSITNCILSARQNINKRL